MKLIKLQDESQAALRKQLDRIKIPNDWDSLEDFATWYRDAGFPLMPPYDTKVYVSDITYSTIVFRRGKYQAELYFVAPNSEIAMHTHDHESMFVLLAGSMEGYREGGSGTSRLGKRYTGDGVDGVDPDYGTFADISVIGENHGLRTLEHGCAFYNLERWAENIVPTSAIEAYIGEPMGPIHEAVMKEYKKT